MPRAKKKSQVRYWPVVSEYIDDIPVAPPSLRVEAEHLWEYIWTNSFNNDNVLDVNLDYFSVVNVCTVYNEYVALESELAAGDAGGDIVKIGHKRYLKGANFIEYKSPRSKDRDVKYEQFVKAMDDLKLFSFEHRDKLGLQNDHETIYGSTSSFALESIIRMVESGELTVGDLKRAVASRELDGDDEDDEDFLGLYDNDGELIEE